VEHLDLVAALERFLDDAEGLARRNTEPVTRAFLPAWARSLANLPSCRAADSAAEVAAMAAGYIVAAPDSKRDRRAGRALGAGALTRTGLAELLLDHNSEYDRHTVAMEVARYLAGPPVEVWDYGMVDAHIRISGPVDLGSDWELVTPTSQELCDLLPVPSARSFHSEQPFDLETYGGLAMLRRVHEHAVALAGHVIYFPSERPALTFWQPLLALSLYRNDVIHLWAHYVVEPGGSVGTRYRDVYTEPWTHDGETFIEDPQHGTYILRPDDEEHFRRFIQSLATLLSRTAEMVGATSKKPRAVGERLHRIARNFLIAGNEAHGQGEVSSEYNAETTLRYVMALEAPLTSGDSGKSDLARKTSQRAAVLAGTNDEVRLAIRDLVNSAYDVRSKYAHGDEPGAVDLPRLRRVVRRCILARLILDDPPPGFGSLGAPGCP
jgi:hypothetical protein